ncbi:ABC transporter substrate-binding protein [Sinorhizobium psoraleae]|uniref:ABC transporter substrate-binding protein n=1 Tax=Sinorhizobium psoraleae TaxID=520838 RepID=A0ABT4KMR1_9HYPH|nr:ABC transporter substrate-binding protein [Sinorhizobium psoraleae]MCZ4093090.1 ABC transporter substrate-binding protein [Sinorhizobium psoraleae]
MGNIFKKRVWAIALVASFIFTVTAQAQQELVIVTTGGTFEKALKENFFDPFEKDSGVKVRLVSGTSGDTWARVKAMSSSNSVEYDIISPNDIDLNEASAGYLHNFGKNCEQVPNVAKDGVDGTCMADGLGILRTVGAGTLVYDTQAFPNGGPKSWADFWDVKRFPGPRTLPADSPEWTVPIALLADGVTADKLFPLDLDRAFRKLDQIKPHITVWWHSNDQSQQAFRSGEVVMGMIVSGRALALRKEGLKLEVVLNGAVRDVAPWAMLKDAPHKDAALAFLNFFMTRPEAHLAFVKAINYQTSNKDATSLIPEAERRNLPTAPENWSRTFSIDRDWYEQNREMLYDRWNAWMLK